MFVNVLSCEDEKEGLFTFLRNLKGYSIGIIGVECNVREIIYWTGVNREIDPKKRSVM